MEISNDSKTLFNKENVERLFTLAIKLSEMELTENKMHEKDFIDWTLKINRADNVDLIALISLLDTRNKNISREVKSLRESAIAQVAYKNATLISGTMKKLDKTATYLTVVSIFLGVIGAVAAVLQLIH